MAGYKIGVLAGRTGTSAPTIRYYEDIGLLPRADRQDGNQRRYDDEDVRRLTFIRRCRDFGFPIAQVRTLVSLAQDPRRSCMEARDLARTQLLTMRAKLEELRALEKSIAGFVDSCEAACAGGPGPDCVILDDLGAVEPRRARDAPRCA